jgi:hypothetical protein
MKFLDLQRVKAQKFTGPLPLSVREVSAFSSTPTALGRKAADEISRQRRRLNARAQSCPIGGVAAELSSLKLSYEGTH